MINKLNVENMKVGLRTKKNHVKFLYRKYSPLYKDWRYRIRVCGYNVEQVVYMSDKESV